MEYGDQLVDRALPAHGVGRPAGGLIVTSAWSMATVRMERRYVRTSVVRVRSSVVCVRTSVVDVRTSVVGVRTSVVGVRTGVLANWCTGDLQGHRRIKYTYDVAKLNHWPSLRIDAQEVP